MLLLLTSREETLVRPTPTILQRHSSETEGEEGRQFAMMAAQRLDVLVNRSSFSLVFFVIAASSAKNGMLVSSSSCFNVVTLNVQ